MVELLRVPYLGTAEEDVLLSEWLVAEGGPFRKGDALAVVETLKASFEVEAEDEGVLVKQLVARGDRIPVQAPLGILRAVDEDVTDAAIVSLVRDAASESATEAPTEAPHAVSDSTATPSLVAPSAAAPSAATPSAATAPAAPAARRRAAELGVSLNCVDGSGPGGMIRVEDVERAASERASSGAPRSGDGTMDPEFIAHLRREGDAFGALSSALKVHLYRLAGARIGEDVRIDPGAVLRCDRLELGDGCRFGAGVTVDAHELVAGRLAQFGPRCAVRCRRVELGDNAFFAPDVEIGGGGAMDPEAELVVGSHGFVGEHVHLNPCRRLELGDEVVVSRGAVVMTHSFGGSVLAGYPNRFAGVRIGDRAQVGIGAVLFPGVEMGDGSILLSGSSLVTAVPAGRLFGGVPARDLKAAATTFDAADRERVARELVLEFAQQLALRGRRVETTSEDRSVAVTVTVDGAVHWLRLVPDLAPALADPAPTRGDVATLPAEDVLAACAADDAAWDGVPPEVVAIDLGAPRIRGRGGPLADAFREFLRKRGVRLEPRTWTYPGGWL